ncbi:MAG: MBL fold metallo-hydrolase, partial [Lentisphaeria bacterium]|nr:MBL fold metallo-hydrolase [Lentisphaeria bacterium]
MFTVKTFPVGSIATNCSLVFFDDEKLLLVIDPGADAAEIIAAAKSFPFKKARILLTHAHVDHISACGEVAKALNVEKVEVAPADAEMYASPENCFFPYFPAAKDLPPATGFAPLPYGKVLALPGHTMGGSGFLFDNGKKQILIAGDTIFCGSIGRTDLPGGDYE